MNSRTLVEEIRRYCIENGNPANVLKYSRFFRGEYIAYGLGSGMVEEKVRQLVTDPTVTIPLVLEAAPDLVVAEKYEETAFVLMLLNQLKKNYTRAVFDSIESWFLYGIHNWAHADILGMWILPDLMSQGWIQPEDFNTWLTSEYTFQRRCVPVTLIRSLKTTPDLNVLFNFIEPLVSDPEREVHQGVGWFLREAWKINREVTEAFLMKHKNTAPRLIIQYATEKMTKEERLAYRKEKTK